jgi:hypothetical protein
LRRSLVLAAVLVLFVAVASWADPHVPTPTTIAAPTTSTSTSTTSTTTTSASIPPTTTSTTTTTFAPLAEWEIEALNQEALILARLQLLYPPDTTTTTTHTHAPRRAGDHEFPEKVERWRQLIRKYFGADWEHWALHVVQCESNGNPDAKNKRSSASGLFQQLGRYWPTRSRNAGWEGADIFDPEANIAVSAWLLGGRRSHTSHWKCKAAHAVP